MQTFTKKVIKRGPALLVAFVLSLSSVTILAPIINNQVASAIDLEKLHYLTIEPGAISLETGITTKSVYIHPETYGNNNVNTSMGSAKITVNTPAGLKVATSESGNFTQSAEISQKAALPWNNEKVAGTFYFKADVSGSYQVPVVATFYGGLKTLNSNLSVNATRTPSLAPSNLRISKNGASVPSGSFVDAKWLSGNVVLDFDAVANSDQYLTEMTYTSASGAVKTEEFWNGYNNTWLVHGNAIQPNQFSTFGDGAYSYRVKSRSAINGDWSEYSNSVSLIYDSQKPTVELVSPSASLFNSEGAVLQINATDNIALDQITANIYQKGSDKVFHSTSIRNINATIATHSVSFSAIYKGNKLPDGDYFVKYNAIDKAGNLSGTYAFDFTIDDTAPYMLLRQGESGPVIESGSIINNTKMNIRIEKENTDTIYILQPNGKTWIGGKKDVSYSGGKLSLDWILKTDGLYTIYVQDEAGNRSADYLLAIDNTRPETQAYLDADINPDKLTITVTDNLGLSQLVVNFKQNGKVISGGNNIIKMTGKTNETVELAVPAGLEDGAYSVSIGASDLASNTASTVNLSFTIDHTAPVAPTVDLDESDATKIIGTSDPDATLVVEIKDFDGNAIPGTLDRDGVDWVFTPNEQLPEGEYTVSAYSVDDADNRSELKPTIFTVSEPVIIETPEETDSTDASANANTPRPIIARNTNNLAINSEQIEEEQIETAANSENDDAEVLGTQTTRNSNGSAKTEAVAESGFQFWWFIILATIGGLFWFIFAKRRKEDEEEA